MADSEGRREPLNVVALLCLIVGFPLVMVGAWQLGFLVMLAGLLVSVVALVRHRRSQGRVKTD